ncbi:hypothetical protein BMS3Abin04_01371 [bacterium BMS3Abin04]|nr:hypothetical protein BMS3Abin04_01371 [bacterium BMS3Abin04]
MDFSPSVLAELFVWMLIILLIIGIILLIFSPKFRRSGSSMHMTTFFGATSEFYNAEQKQAMEQIVEEQAGKKMKEQESGEPEKK